ncbi:hypothetical protein LEA_14898 [human gut metagenome]|uniref:Uncharacterized protein n=1 Tax=human gut metagenome TaxID=408170 RepID=K1SLL5_9ZZZZ
MTSLSETLLALPGAENEEMKQGLETIHSTGKGLRKDHGAVERIFFPAGGCEGDYL